MPHESDVLRKTARDGPLRRSTYVRTLTGSGSLRGRYSAETPCISERPVRATLGKSCPGLTLSSDLLVRARLLTRGWARGWRDRCCNNPGDDGSGWEDGRMGGEGGGHEDDRRHVPGAVYCVGFLFVRSRYGTRRLSATVARRGPIDPRTPSRGRCDRRRGVGDPGSWSRANLVSSVARACSDLEGLSGRQGSLRKSESQRRRAGEKGAVVSEKNAPAPSALVWADGAGRLVVSNIRPC